MGLFDHVFSGAPRSDNPSRQLPDNLVHEAFGEVNVRLGRKAKGSDIQLPRAS